MKNNEIDSPITAGRLTTHCLRHWEYNKYRIEIQIQHTSNKDTTLTKCATTNHITSELPASSHAVNGGPHQPHY